jgi:hypothetical protein
MAKLRSLKLKNKEFTFTAFENDKEAAPAKIIFSRFPRPDETFTEVNKRKLLVGVKAEDFQKDATRSKILDNLVNEFLENMKNSRTDYRAFFNECVDHFVDLEYGDSKIVTVPDFFQILPQDAAYKIAKEAFDYATQRDEFTMGESSA